MPNIYISADLEGVCGVSSYAQCYPKDDATAYRLAVDQLALEIHTVAEAFWQADQGTTLWVNDAHCHMTNLDIDHLPPNIHLVSGKPKVCAMMAGLGSSYDAAILLGYHAKAGTLNGVLNHTFYQQVLEVSINGVSYGEGGVNTLYAALVHQIPVCLASGDQAFCNEIRSQFPGMHTVETKVGLSTTAAVHHAWDTVQSCYQSAVSAMLAEQTEWPKQQHAIQKTLKAPYTLEISFLDTLSCDVVMLSPLYQRVDGRTVTVTTENFHTLYQALQAAYTMATVAEGLR